jgi:hypothetical protein
VHINQADAPGRSARINEQGEDGKRAPTGQVYAFKIDVYDSRVLNWGCMAEDESVDQIADLLGSVDGLCFDVSEHGGGGAPTGMNMKKQIF